ncbi:MAG: hypothetical protein DRN66_01230 [Candidatus Nanohalarchaeota archaeon]|nr:MAG: hypothetical protein DRN66_01230 [Candidatus Nanohaloarchaeota archaeon]
MNQFNKLKSEIKICDFVIEVVDSRCSFLYHCHSVHNFCKKEDKGFLVVVAKCELIPDYFKKKISKKFNDIGIDVSFVSSKTRYGILRLKSMLKSKAKRRKINVLLFGMPNAGKSTLANTLIGRHSAGTSPIPGHTRGVQYLKMSKNVMLFDTKGITNMKTYSNLEEALFCKNPENTGFLVEKILKMKRGNMEQYGVDLNKCENDPDSFLKDLAKQKNLIHKNNIIDINRAKEKIMSDWHKGKLTSWWVD